MSRILSVLRGLSAVAVCIIAGLLCWQCIDIYTVGNNMPQSIDINGVHLTSLFRMDDVAARLRALAAPLSLCMLIIASTFILSQIAGNPPYQTSLSKCCSSSAQQPEISATKVRLLRRILLALALAFILLGVMNGGLYDVLVKAINICTECIGLG